jgi:agmatine deiminase
VNEDTVLSVVETNVKDDNYNLLQQNIKALNKMRLLNGKQLNIIELPMPDAVAYDGMRLPASYANFYISNKYIIVPTYRCDKDKIALDLITKCFPDRKIAGLDSTDIIWGLGSFHCLSQQEPLV